MNEVQNNVLLDGFDFASLAWTIILKRVGVQAVRRDNGSAYYFFSATTCDAASCAGNIDVSVYQVHFHGET